MYGSTSTNRRTLLRRGLLLIAGALGLATVEREMRAESVPSRPGAGLASQPAPLILYGRRWRPQAQSQLLGRRSDGDHVVAYGDLLDGPDGAVVGRFCTNGFCPEAPFGHRFAAAPTIEFQTLTLADGTLFGMAAGDPDAGNDTVHAVLGGTGRFAGARGTYATRTTSAEPNGRGAVEFILTLTT